MRVLILGGLAIVLASAATPAFARDSGVPSWGGPMPIGDGVTLDPIVDLRLRYEHVDQDNATDTGNALTARLRAGAEIKAGDFAFLTEGEGTFAPVDRYNAFPFAAEAQNRSYDVVTDPENIELNRAQINWVRKGSSVTLGRQRINLDDQRWVGSVGWRQNEQTFDAVRGTARVGLLSLDATYANGQRTIFGVDAGKRQAYDGDFVFLGAGVATGPVTVKGFVYLLDYDDPLMAASSSKTFGILATGALPLGPKAKVAFKASYANQSDWKTVARNYNADYLALEGQVSVIGVTVTGGYELLGSDNGVGLATPMATLHKFNGWADVFLNTPAGGLQDIYLGAAYTVPGRKGFPALNLALAWHDFDSDRGSMNYGSEWDASLGFRLGRVSVLAKYARYDARDFSVDTEKVWLQLEYGF